MSRISHPPNRALNRALTSLVVMLAATVTLIASAFTAWAANDITITFVRHGESEGNASGFINTAIPGPDLTADGQAQATAIGQALANDGQDYTSVYDSNMIRTQQTAAPFVADTGLSPTTLNGLHEVQAGIFEGAPQNSGIERIFYALIPLAWSLGLYSVPMPGSADATGSNFESRFNGAVQTMYQNGGDLPVAFSHGMAIMAWTLMNVKNPDLMLMLTDPLSNTDTVSVTGNPTDGWTLVSWGGKAVTQNPGLLTKLMVNVRDLIATPQMAMFNFTQALQTGNIGTIANTIRTGVFSTLGAAVNFPINVVKSVVKSITTGTLFTAAKPPAGVFVPPSGSTLDSATGVPASSDTVSTVAAAAITTSKVSKATTKVTAAVTKSDKADTDAATVTAEPDTSGTVAPTKSTQESSHWAKTHAASDTETSATTDTKSDSTKASSSKAKRVRGSDSTAASQKSGSAKSDSAKSDNKSDTTTKKKSGAKKSVHTGAGKAGAASGGSSSGNSGSSSGHHGGSK